MVFLDPRMDIAFKKLFGSQERAALTISLLNSVLERREGELITLVEIKDGKNRPITKDKEPTAVDVYCTDQKKNQYIIEMQVRDEKNFRERSQFYASFVLSRQLEEKKSYTSLVPVIFVGILDFDLFKDNPDYLSHHWIVNSKTGKRTLDHLEWHYIELNKFAKEADELTNDLEKWTYFFKNANKMNQIPAALKTSQELVMAFDVLEQHHWKEADLEKYYAELDVWRCAVDSQRGHREEGLKEGELRKANAIASALLAKNMPHAEVAQITGLSVEEIKKLG